MEGEIVDKEGQELTLLLNHAADGLPGAVEAFLERLLSGHVYVPLRGLPGTTENSGPDVALVGEDSAEERGFLTVVYDSKPCLPIFSQEQYLLEWAEREMPFVRKTFKSLLWIVGDDNWMYINPNQEVGKEITEWEIARLRQGVEAIPEIVASLSEVPYAEIEVRSGEDLYPELKRKLLPILELYPELNEAFLVTVKEGDAEAEKPLLGVKWAKVKDAKRIYVKHELEECIKDFLSEKGGHITVIDDLGDKSSHNHTLFADSTPFYFANREPRGFKKVANTLKTMLGVPTAEGAAPAAAKTVAANSEDTYQFDSVDADDDEDI